MDEQLLRIRIAALEAAARMRSSVATATLIEDAEAFEAWLTRPAPVDASKADDVHDAETTADRLGYQRCPTGWRNVADTRKPHVCRWAPGHTVDRECACGSTCDMP